MSTETLSSRAPETHPAVDPETIAEINSIDSSHDSQPETPEEFDDRVPSRLAERIRITVERVTEFLDRRAINKAHGQALREDFRRTRETQAIDLEVQRDVDTPEVTPPETEEDEPTIEDSADEEPTVETDTEAPENGEKKERLKRTKAVLRRIGLFAVVQLEANGLIPLRGTWHKRGGVTGFIAKRYVKAQENKRRRLLSDHADQPPTGEQGDTEPPADDELLEDDGAEDDEHTPEAEPPTEVEEIREQAKERAREARKRKADRKEKVPMRERAAGLWQKLFQKRGKIGAKALSFFVRAGKRAGASAAAAVTAWKNFGQE